MLAAGVDVITSGNHIWDKREIYPYLETSERVLRPLNYGTHEVPGRGWGTYQALDGTDIAVINLQGRTYMQPIENPFTDADRLLDEASEPLPPVRLVDFHCELTSEKNALGLYLDGRVSVVVGHAHPRRHRRRADPAQRHGLPDRPRHDRPGLERHRLRPADRPAALHQRAADALRGRRRARSSSTRSRSTSIRPPAGRSRSSGSSASSRPDVTAPPGRQRGDAARSDAGAARRRAARPVAGRPAHAHDAGPTASWSRPSSSPRPRRRRHDCSPSPTTTRSPATARSSPRGAVPAGLDARSPASRSTRSSPATSGCGRASSTSSGSAWTRTTRRSRPPRRASATSAASRFASDGRPPARARPADRRPGGRARSDEQRRARPADHRPGADRGGPRRQRRGRLPPAPRARLPGLRAARRAWARSTRSRRSAPPAGCRSSPTSARRRSALDVLRELMEAGLGGLEVHYRSFDAGTVDAVGGRRQPPRAPAHRRHRLPRRHGAVRGGARRAVGAAGGRRGARSTRDAAVGGSSPSGRRCASPRSSLTNVGRSSTGVALACGARAG